MKHRAGCDAKNQTCCFDNGRDSDDDDDDFDDFDDIDDFKRKKRGHSNSGYYCGCVKLRAGNLTTILAYVSYSLSLCQLV